MDDIPGGLCPNRRGKRKVTAPKKSDRIKLKDKNSRRSRHNESISENNNGSQGKHCNIGLGSVPEFNGGWTAGNPVKTVHYSITPLHACMEGLSRTLDNMLLVGRKIVPWAICLKILLYVCGKECNISSSHFQSAMP